MKKSMRSFLIGVLLTVWGLSASAKEYIELSPPRPTDDPSKVEVIEFFWYGCPHCYRFEPFIAAWVKEKPDNVVFKRQPVIFRDGWAQHARAYFTAEVLGVVDKTHQDFFDAMHKERKSMTNEDELAEFFSRHGVDKETFSNAFHSFSVDMKVRQAESVAAEYMISGVPAIVVNGKYLITGRTAKGFDNMIKVLQERVNHELENLTAKK